MHFILELFELGTDGARNTSLALLLSRIVIIRVLNLNDFYFQYKIFCTRTYVVRLIYSVSLSLSGVEVSH